MKIVITGAHFTPAQAVIEELQILGDIRIVYFGRLHTREGDQSASAESMVLPKMGVKFVPIITGRLQRAFTRHTIPSLLKIPIGTIQSFYYLLKEQPDVVLAFGGYVSVPVVFSAWLLSIPIIIHEQTLVTGLATDICSLFADKIAVSFEKSGQIKTGKYVLVGNPLRREILDAYKKFKDPEQNIKSQNIGQQYRDIVKLSKKEKLPLMLVTAGNQGSHLINQTVDQAIDVICKNYCLIHQTGDSKYNDFNSSEMTRSGMKNPERYLIKKWIEASDLGYLLANADLSVCRAGINTLMESTYFNVPSLVIPLPYVAKDEQNVNAEYFQNNGISVILPQSQLTAESLIAKIQQILKKKRFPKPNLITEDIIFPDAARRLAVETITLSSTRL